MTFTGVAFKNVFRNRFRTIMTIAGVAIAILAFIFLRTVLYAWTVAADFAAKDRVATRHKVTFVMSIPKKYVDEIRNVPGVKAASYANWFGAKYPGHESEFFANMAMDPASSLEVWDEIQLTPEEKESWIGDKQGAIVGNVLAKKFGWKVGDKVTLTGTIYPGDWQFHISGIYKASRKSIDESSFFFHWDYMNDSLPERRRDQIGWVASRIDDPSKAADIAAAIDKIFDDRETQTISMSERAMQTDFLGTVSAVLKAIDVVSLVILVIMMLILGNTIAMGVRERTNEYGVLRAIGFLPKHLVIFVLGEAAMIGLIGGALGLLLAYPIVNQGMGKFIEENMGSYFPYFRVADATWAVAMALAVALALAAAAFPAYRASKLHVVDALRRIG